MSIHDHLPNVARRAAGQLVEPANFKRWEPRAFCAQGGSKNEAHIAYASAGDFRWIAAVAKLQCEEFGLCIDELGAGQEFYGIAPRVGEMLCLKLARAAGDQESAHWIGRVLRSYWHWLALGSMPVPVRQGWQMIGLGERPRGREFTAAGNSDVYTGPSCTIVGDRWNRGTEGAEQYGMFLAWAADWQPRALRNRGGQPKPLGVRARDGGLSLDVIANLGGVTHLHDDIKAEMFGLQPGDRGRLQAVIRGDAGAAAEAAAIVVQECPPHGDYRMTRIRRDGAAESISERTRNGNKPHCAYSSLDASGFRQTLLPADFEKIGADAIWVRVLPDKIEAGDSDSFVFAPRPGGPMLYGFHFADRAVERLSGGSIPPHNPPPPPDRPDPAPEPPVPPNASGGVVLGPKGTHVRLPQPDGGSVILNILPGDGTSGTWQLIRTESPR